MEPAAHPLILVVEDELAIANLLCDVLEEHGYRCVAASGADGAMRLLEAVRPALITLDLGLPGVSGQALLRILRGSERTHDTPVIIISAERVIEPQLRSASQAVVAKPFDMDDLVGTVQQVLGARAAEHGREAAPSHHRMGRQSSQSTAARHAARAGASSAEGRGARGE